MVQRMKRQTESRRGFRQGEDRTRRKKDEPSVLKGTPEGSEEILANILNGVKYLRQEVEFLKNCQDGKYSNGEILMSAGGI